jgi:hypothetical protein
MVFQQQEEAKQLLDGVVSAMMEVRKNEGLLIKGVSATERSETIAGQSCFGNDGSEKNDGGKEMKNVEQWCFSIRKNDERLLVISVSAMGGK